MYAFSPKLAMTYEMPLVKQIDYSDLREFEQIGDGAELPPGQGGPLPPGGVAGDLEDDGDNTGIGDLGLRLFYMPDELKWKYSEEDNFTAVPCVETTLPTGSDDVLSGRCCRGAKSMPSRPPP